MKNKQEDFSDKNNYPVTDITGEIAGNRKIYYEHYDLEYTKAIVYELVASIDEIWFRSVLIGWENFPQRNNPERPLIFATNHSGMAFPWDAMIFGAKLNGHLNFNKDSIRPLSAPMLSQSALMNPFIIEDLWKKTGAIDATFFNFETMMFYNKQNLLIYPEGVPGIGKGFNRRYELQQLKTSFIRMSIKYKTDIITVSTINGEYINPVSYSSRIVNRFIRMIGIPFLPLGPMTIFILLQPWIFYFGFPAKLVYVLGKRIKPYDMINKSYEEITQEEFREIADKVHTIMQEELTNAKNKYGKHPWDIKDLFKSMFKNFKLLPYGFPTAWAIIFQEFNRLFKKHGCGNFKLKAGFFRNFWLMIKNPITFAYFIPILGWIPIAIRGYRDNNLNNNK